MSNVTEDRSPNVGERMLGLVTEVRAGEGARALLMGLAIFLLLSAYYVIKTVREPMLLATGSAELKAYASAGQALALMGFVPLYAWLSSRVTRGTLIAGVVGFFLVCLQLFYPAAREAAALAAQAETIDRAVTTESFLSLGFVFYVWVGIFSLATIAQFWSFANDIYSREEGDRLFPLIGIGMTSGAAVGSLVPGWLREHLGLQTPEMLQAASVLLVVHGALLFAIHRVNAGDRAPGTRREAADAPLRSASGFTLIFRDRYLMLIAGVILLLNLVNTLGEYLLSDVVLARAIGLEAVGEITDVGDFIGDFYGTFFFWVNITTFLVQTFLVSRIVKYGGIAAVVLALPCIALGAYGLLAVGVGFAVFRVAKMAENTTDYSVMNTGKALLWLPTSREAKYQAKQAVDTFVVRLGDLLQAGVVFLGLQVFAWSQRSFALVNVGLVLVWLALTVSLIRAHRARAAVDDDAPSVERSSARAPRW